MKPETLADVEWDDPFEGSSRRWLALPIVPDANLTANGVPFEEVLKLANLGGLTATGKTNPVV